ncbi:hypothetical protein CRP01_18535 [Flavilitoribacter nigricans DSM 23189 = NBRC 102662]|uniref:Uncharacterized protein n=2 Tax=Flavilitoribacter TaxID=2762562 RepID=A0A2D0N963_FLAN2|nr:hypothetical protein CRP01_18535 [Flavilitoribacter nigricans DSM 23189 = NBRC 102662]
MTLLLLLTATLSLSAQLKHTQHQTFQLDSIDQVLIDLVDPYTVETWAGNQLMTETQVQLYQASESVLQFFLKNERYTIVSDSNSTELMSLLSKDTERKRIRTKFGECEERITVRIFVPKNFEQKGEKLWARPPKTEEEK